MRLVVIELSFVLDSIQLKFYFPLPRFFIVPKISLLLWYAYLRKHSLRTFTLLFHVFHLSKIILRTHICRDCYKSFLTHLSHHFWIILRRPDPCLEMWTCLFLIWLLFWRYLHTIPWETPICHCHEVHNRTTTLSICKRWFRWWRSHNWFWQNRQ